VSEFEKYMKEQRLLLDSEQASDGHEARFLQKLERQHALIRNGRRPGSGIRFRHVLQIAASVAILLTSSVLLLRYAGDRPGEQQAELPASLVEAKAYYVDLTNERVSQIEAFDFSSNEEKTLLLDELQEMEVYHQQLMDDLKAHPDDERVISAMIRHYQLKLEVMDQIINQLKQIKLETTENHENESV